MQRTLRCKYLDLRCKWVSLRSKVYVCKSTVHVASVQVYEGTVLVDGAYPQARRCRASSWCYVASNGTTVLVVCSI